MNMVGRRIGRCDPDFANARIKRQEMNEFLADIAGGSGDKDRRQGADLLQRPSLSASSDYA